jgi:hypothetical protein
MTEYLLNEALYSKTIREHQVKFPNGYDFYSLPEERKDFARLWGAWDSDISAYEFAYFLFHLLVFTAVKAAPSNRSMHDGKGTLRKGAHVNNALVVAASQRAVNLFLDHYSRKSCGDAMAPGSSFILTLLTEMAYSSTRTEQINLNILHVVSTCYAEISERAASKQYAIDVLNFPHLHTLFRCRFLGTHLGGMPGTDKDHDINVRIRCELFFETARFLNRLSQQPEFSGASKQAVLVGVGNILLETMQCSASEKVQMLQRVATRTGHTVVDHRANISLLRGGRVLMPLLPFHEDTDAHAFAVFVLVKLMRDALRPVQNSCRGGVREVLGRRAGCHDKFLLMHIALYAADANSLTGAGLLELQALWHGLRSRNRATAEAEPEAVVTDWDIILFAKPHVFDIRDAAAGAGGAAAPTAAAVAAADSMSLMMACYREVLSEAAFREINEVQQFAF